MSLTPPRYQTESPGCHAGLSTRRSPSALTHPRLARLAAPLLLLLAAPAVGQAAAPTTPNLGTPLEYEPAFLVSVFKPVLFLLLLLGWAWLVSRLDKDAAYYYVSRNLWGAAHLISGLVAFGLLLVIPIFWLGLPIALLIIGGVVVGYAMARNKEVPEQARWTLDIASFKQSLEHRKDARAIRQSPVVLRDSNSQDIVPPESDDPNAEPHQVVTEALEFAIPRNAERLEIAIDSEKAAITARIDGVRYPVNTPDPRDALKAVDYLKSLASLDPEERRKKQKGRLGASLEGYGDQRLALTTSGSSRGLSLQLDLNPPTEFPHQLDSLGLSAQQLQLVKTLRDEPGRVILVTGPTRSGVSSMLLSILSTHDAYTSSVVTFEKSTPFSLEGVGHNNYDPTSGKDQLYQELASLLRGDPNTVYLDALPNTDAVHMVAKSAEDMRFYIPLNAPDASAALRMWIKMVGDRKLAAESLGGIIACRLLRTLCQTCRAAYTPAPDALKKLGLPAKKDLTLYRASGKVLVKDKEQTCPACLGLGYRGRLGVYEVMPLDKTARSYIAAGEGDHLKAHLRKNGMASLQDNALAKVVEGLTDIQEVRRVMSEDK
ncbi:MAG: ATPase, T2SS/T4P/T4SS family [Planctomycetota bacterium]